MPLAPISSNDQSAPSFTYPTLLYTGNVKGQTVMIDFKSFIAKDTKRIGFLIFIEVGNAMVPVTTCFAKLSNSRDYHYSVFKGRPQGTYYTASSEEFTLINDVSYHAFLEVSEIFGGTDHLILVYITGVYNF